MSAECKDIVLGLINQKDCNALQHLEDIFDVLMQCLYLCENEKYVGFLSVSVSF